jgi:hypothetical protein
LIVPEVVNQGPRMPSPKPEKFEDQRQSPRYPFERVARLQPADGGKVVFCLVVDTSDGGIRLRAAGKIKIPDQFRLQIAGDDPANGTYEVVWRLGSDVGAKCLPPVSDTEWSY